MDECIAHLTLSTVHYLRFSMRRLDAAPEAERGTDAAGPSGWLLSRMLEPRPG